MANAIMILGASGTGKSSSIKTLNPKETIIINVLKKKLPFKGSSSFYNNDNKNLFNIDEYSSIISLLNSINTAATHVKNVVIDDMSYVIRKEYYKTAKITGLTC